MKYLIATSASILFAMSNIGHAQEIRISDTRAKCIKEVTGLDPYINGRLRIYPTVHEAAIFNCIQKAELNQKPTPPINADSKRKIEKETATPPKPATAANTKPITQPSSSATAPAPIVEVSTAKTEDVIFVEDVQLFFTGGGAVDVVTFVPLLQAAKQQVESKQTDSNQGVSALKEYLNTNQAFQTFYNQLMSRRADERKQEKEKLLLAVKNAEKPITDYIRANLNDPNLTQYLDAIKMIGTANSETSSDNLKIIIGKISSLNPAYAQSQSLSSNASGQKALIPAQSNAAAIITSSNSDFNSIFPSGIYAKSEKDCARYLANPKKMRMDERFERVTIEGKEISRYSTGSCTVRNIAGTGPNYTISADCTEEGETTKQKYVFSTRDGKFNFGLFDEFGKTWWNFCKPASTLHNGLSSNAFIGREISIGSRCGASASISSISGVNTSEARFMAQTTLNIAKDACLCDEPDLKGAKLEICANEIIKRSRPVIATANCDKGTVNDTNGRSRQFTGRVRDENLELIDVKTQKRVEAASYTGYHVSLEQLSVMCPSKVCLANYGSTEYLAGCKK